MRYFDCDCMDEFGNPYMIKDVRKKCAICGNMAYFVKRMPVDGEPNEDGGYTAFNDNVCFNCADHWDDIVANSM